MSTWTCPRCARTVPGRISACRCGYANAAVDPAPESPPVATAGVPEIPSEKPSSSSAPKSAWALSVPTGYILFRVAMMLWRASSGSSATAPPVPTPKATVRTETNEVTAARTLVGVVTVIDAVGDRCLEAGVDMTTYRETVSNALDQPHAGATRILSANRLSETAIAADFKKTADFDASITDILTSDGRDLQASCRYFNRHGKEIVDTFWERFPDNNRILRAAAARP